MDAAIVGVVGTLLGSLLGLVAAGLQRRSDARQREADRDRADQVRQLDQRERVNLHWLDKKHEVYSDFLTAVDGHIAALAARMNPAGTGRIWGTEAGETRFSPGPFPVDSQAALGRTFNAVVIVASAPVADAAFKVLVALHVKNQREEWLSEANHRDDVSFQQTISSKAQAAQANVEQCKERLRTAIREDLGTGGTLDLSAEIPE